MNFIQQKCFSHKINNGKGIEIEKFSKPYIDLNKCNKLRAFRKKKEKKRNDTNA